MTVPSKKRLGTISVVVLVCVIGITLIGVQQTHAAWDSAVLFVVNKVFYVIFELAANLLSLLVRWLNLAINMRISTDVSVVQSTWKIVRDFTNMFFIIIMIAMAFSMIFKVSWLSDYEPGRIMAQFIIAALLINFSLVICGLIIDGTQSLNSIFITAIGDFGDRMGQFLNPSQWFALTNRDVLNTPQLFFASIMVFIVDFSLLVAVVFTFIRVPFLWFLIILSPLALLASVLPNTKKAYQNWWQQFIGWNFFLPIFLAVIYLGMIFLSQQDTVISSIITTSTNSADHQIVAGLNITIQTLFFYFLVAFMLIGGTNAAIKGSLIAGVGAVQGAQWAKNLALRQTGIGAFGTAAQERWKQIQKEGYGKIPGTQAKLFGGPAPLTGLAGRSFGVKGFEQQTLIAKEITAEKKNLEEEQRSVEELRGIMQSDKGARGLAAGELLLKDKKLKMGEIVELRKRYADLKSPRGIAERGFQERAQAQLEDMAENDRYKNREEFEEAFNTLPKDGADAFLRKARKGNVNPIWIAEAQQKENERKLAELGDAAEAKDRAKYSKSAEELLEESLAKMTPKEILALSPESLKALTADSTGVYSKVLERWLSIPKIDALYKGPKNKREAIDGFLQNTFPALIDAEIDRIDKAMKALADQRTNLENNPPATMSGEQVDRQVRIIQKAMEKNENKVAALRLRQVTGPSESYSPEES